MLLTLPEGFPTEVAVLERPSADWLPAGRWTLVGDEKVRPAWELAGLPQPPGTLWVALDEHRKQLATLVPWLEHWAALPLNRHDSVVAVGGGILTDMAGLAAALFLRGIDWHAWPTTLLAQVDAGLGGKTAVNLAAGKNLAGAFHAPRRLVACRSFLDTLPARELQSGKWELIKMALLVGDLSWAETLLLEDLPAAGSIQEALRGKALIVHVDPFEQNQRRLLNLGHTLGHALESASGHALLHGEAVGLGLLGACALSEDLDEGRFPAEFMSLLAAKLKPLKARISPWAACLPFLTRDKKAFRDAEGIPAIHSILPLPGRGALQRPVGPDLWAHAYARMADLIARPGTP
jgi:3-dehydroquinate synthetase